MTRVPTEKNNPTPAERDEKVSLYREDSDPEEVLAALLAVKLDSESEAVGPAQRPSRKPRAPRR